MKKLNYSYSLKKDQLLRETRNIGFEDIIGAIATGRILEIKPHPNIKKYPNQSIFIVNVDNYAYVVPCVIKKNHVLLKTIYPHRKSTEIYLRKKS